MNSLITIEMAMRRHRQMLLLSVVVLVASFLLEIVPGERVALPGLASFPLPGLCMSHSVLGIDCPGCGLTRSFVHLAHGQWRGSVATHRLGWLLAASLVVQLPYRLYCLHHRSPGLPATWTTWFGRTLIALLFLNWAVSLVLPG